MSPMHHIVWLLEVGLKRLSKRGMTDDAAILPAPEVDALRLNYRLFQMLQNSPSTEQSA
jgi:hypothetical protein